MKRAREGSHSNFGTPGRGHRATEKEAAGAGWAGPRHCSSWILCLGFKCKTRVRGGGVGGGARGLCSSFNRPKDPGGLALFPNLKIFSGVGELPYGEAGRLEEGEGGLKLTVVATEDGE